MSGEFDQDAPHSVDAKAPNEELSSGIAGEGIPPFGWYYFGPEPPFAQSGANPGQGGPQGMGYDHACQTAWHHGGARGAASPYAQARGDNNDLKEAFDRLSRGDLSADTIGKLLNLDDRDFWTGALVGAAAALLATNLPTLMSMFSAAARPKAGAGQSDETTKAKSDET